MQHCFTPLEPINIEIAAAGIRGALMQEAVSPFPPTEIATKLVLSMGIGLLVGFEREWSHKDLGVRTFTTVTLPSDKGN
jgi:hypothetical protein